MASEVKGEARQLVRDVCGALGDLSVREQEILRLRFGIGDRTHDRDEVGVLVGLTQWRIRQIEGQALRKLRVAALSAQLDINTARVLEELWRLPAGDDSPTGGRDSRAKLDAGNAGHPPRGRGGYRLRPWAPLGSRRGRPKPPIVTWDEA